VAQSCHQSVRERLSRLESPAETAFKRPIDRFLHEIIGFDQCGFYTDSMLSRRKACSFPTWLLIWRETHFGLPAAPGRYARTGSLAFTVSARKHCSAQGIIALGSVPFSACIRVSTPLRGPICLNLSGRSSRGRHSSEYFGIPSLSLKALAMSMATG
jgi:hypothetical protein